MHCIFLFAWVFVYKTRKSCKWLHLKKKVHNKCKLFFAAFDHFHTSHIVCIGKNEKRCRLKCNGMFAENKARATWAGASEQIWQKHEMKWNLSEKQRADFYWVAAAELRSCLPFEPNSPLTLICTDSERAPNKVGSRLSGSSDWFSKKGSYVMRLLWSCLWLWEDGEWHQ